MVGPSSPEPKKGFRNFGEASPICDREDDEKGIPRLKAVVLQPSSGIALQMSREPQHARAGGTETGTCISTRRNPDVREAPLLRTGS